MVAPIIQNLNTQSPGACRDISVCRQELILFIDIVYDSREYLFELDKEGITIATLIKSETAKHKVYIKSVSTPEDILSFLKTKYTNENKH